MNAGVLTIWAVSLWMAEVPLPGTSSVSVGLAPSDSCAECHGGFDAESASSSWLGSAMGHTARNPLVLSALTEAEKDSPGIGDLCLRCHAPEAWLQGRCADPDGSMLVAEDSGVTCTVCHRMTESPWVRNGQYSIGEDLDYRGPYSDSESDHHTLQSAWISDSKLCGSCHDFWNPRVVRRDANGVSLGTQFPEQTTYTEWATSAFARPGEFAKGCKDCHMPEAAAKVAMEGPVRTDRSSHEFSGGNIFLLGAIKFLEPGLGLSEELEFGQARARAMLKTAATLSVIDPPAQVRRGEPFTFTIRVTNETGHKLPTGYPEGRRVWLSVVSAPLGIMRGIYDEAIGEPITPAAIYRVEQGQSSIGRGHRLALNDVVFADSRIPPRGMTVTATTAPVGKTYPEVEPGVLAHWDDVTFTATVPCDLVATQIPIAAQLFYQSVTKAYVDALVRENGAHPRGERLELAFDEADPGPLDIAELDLNLAIDPLSSCDMRDAGSPGMTDGSETSMPQPEDDGCSCATTQVSDVDGVGGLSLLTLILACASSSRKRHGKRASSR